MWSVNVLGVVNGLRAFVPRLIEHGVGHIINTASVVGLASYRNAQPYTATKHAVVALSESLRDELHDVAPTLRVSVVCPAVVDTNLCGSSRLWPADLGPSEARGLSEAAVDERGARTRRAAQSPDDVARAVAAAVADPTFLVFPDDETRQSAQHNRNAIFGGADAVRHLWS